MMETLGDALPKEIQRVQELIVIYDTIPTGIFAATMMRHSISKAVDALAQGDVAAMILSYKDLQGYTG